MPREQLNVRVREDLPKRVRVQAAQENRRPRDVVEDALDAFLTVPAQPREPIPGQLEIQHPTLDGIRLANS
jgi:hypothetical protein